MKQRTLIIGAVVALLVLMGGGLAWYGTRTPLWSLWQAKLAFQNHDVRSFERYVDLENLVGRTLEQMQAWNTDKARRTGNLWDQLLQSFAQGLLTTVKSQLVSRLHAQARAYVSTGSFEEAEKDAGNRFFTLKHLYEMVGGGRVELRGIEFVKTEQKTALVGLKLQHKVLHGTLSLELKMRELDGYWRVFEFDHFSEYMKKLIELEARPNSGARK